VEDTRALPVDGSLFEALFHLHAPTGVLAEKLQGLGVGVDHARARRYRPEQWRDALLLYRDHLFPLDFTPAGFRKLGFALGQSYGSTLSGRLLSLALPMLSPMQLLRRWPRFVRMGRTDVDIDIAEHGPRAVVITSRDPVDVPMELNLGLLDFVFEKMGEKVTFESRTLPTGEVAVTCRW
jgi:uncharacterized protein (TIGR02265 family)